jgi:hypothetical protein
VLTLYPSYLTYVYPYTKKYPIAHPLFPKLHLTPPPSPPYYLPMTQTQADLIAEARKWLDLLCRSVEEDVGGLAVRRMKHMATRRKMDIYGQAKEVAHKLVSFRWNGSDWLSMQTIRACVEDACQIPGFGELSGERREMLVRELETIYQTVINYDD